MSDQGSPIEETSVNHRTPIIVSSLIIVGAIVFGSSLTMLRNNTASLETYVQAPDQSKGIYTQVESSNCGPIRAMIASNKTLSNYMRCNIPVNSKSKIKLDPQCTDVNNLSKTLASLMAKNRCSSQAPASAIPYPLPTLPAQSSIPIVSPMPLPSPISTIMPITYANEGGLCNGAAGTQCAPGLVCGPMPDWISGPDTTNGSGICIKPSQTPVPPVKLPLK